MKDIINWHELSRRLSGVMVKTLDLTRYQKSTKKKLLVCSKFSKRGSVGKIGHNYFPQDDGSIKDCDGNTIAEATDSTIEYDGGCFSAEEIIQ